MKEGESVKAAFVSNLIVSIIKGVAAISTMSAGMIAETVHSAADCINQALLWLGMKRSKREPTEEHPFGFGKEQYFWSFIVAIMLFSGGSVWSIYEGIHKLVHPEPIRYAFVNFGILAISLVLEGRAWLVARRELGSPCASEFYEEVVDCKNPSTVVVLVEDTGAMIGLVLAFAGNLLSWITNDPMWDSISSITIGILLVYMSYFLANEMRKSLIGERIDPISIRYIRRLLNAHPAVDIVGEIKTMQMGSDSGFVGVEVDFKDNLRDGDLDKIIPQLEEKIQNVIPEAEHIFIEPANLKKDTP